jgi:hypothetical protein
VKRLLISLLTSSASAHIRVKTLWVVVLVGSCVIEPTLAADGSDSTPQFRQLPFSLTNANDRIVPLDFDGDGVVDLLTADEQTLSLYFQRAQANSAPFYFDKADAVLTLPGAATTWDVDVTTAVGPTPAEQPRIVAIVDGKQVMSWSIQNRQWTKPTTLVDNIAGFLPTGTYPSRFIRDINGDGLNDIVVPSATELTLYLQRGNLQQNNKQQTNGQYDAGVSVRFRMIQFSRLITPKNIAGRGVGQTVRIPTLDIRDINSDGFSDLIANSDEVVEVFLSDQDGHITNQPSYSLDLSAIQEKLGEPDMDNIDFSNLSALLAYTYDFELNDINGDGFEDLLLREGGKISVFAGTANGMDLSRPRQILKSAGNVLGAHLRDEDDDGRKDLWLIRLQDISLGNIFLWLAISGSIDLEAFVYKNVSANNRDGEGGQQFSPRPHRKVTVTIKFPSLFRSASMLMDSAEESTAGKLLRTARAQVTAATDQSSAENDRDLLRLQASSIGVFKQVIDQQNRAPTFLGIQDPSKLRDNYVINLEPMITNPVLFANRDLQLIDDKNPDFEIPLPEGFDNDPEQGDIIPIDLNADQVDDIFVFSQRDDDHVSGLLLLSR